MACTRALALAVLTATLAPGLAVAEVFTVTLHNGAIFDTRYTPQEASWDSNQVLLLSEVGNWVAIDKADIASVTTLTETLGFGSVIDTTTIALGAAPNDRPDETAVATPGETAAGLSGAQVAAAADALRRSGQSAAVPEETPYSVEQFAEPDSTMGIPGGLIGSGGQVPPTSEPGFGEQ